jgi:hypothetical protein
MTTPVGLRLDCPPRGPTAALRSGRALAAVVVPAIGAMPERA